MPPATVVVCDACRIQTLDRALRVARPGATIVVRGVAHGDFVVTKPVTLVGAHGAALDGNGRGTVLTVHANDVTISNLSIRGSGSDFLAMDAGIRSDGARTRVIGVTVSNTLFGIYFARSDGSAIDRAHIEGRRAVPLPLRGDGIRVWYSRGVHVSNSSVEDARDDLIWFSPDARLEHNTVRDGRYGFHSMYSDGMTLVWNDVRGCEVGSYLMYGKKIDIEHNLFVENRGSTGYGVGLKSIDDATVSANAFVSNHIGVYVDNAPSFEGSIDRFRDNVLAYNEIGFAGLPSARGDVLTENTFLDNYRQAAVFGGGALAGIAWSSAGRGNYWSDYAGYDRNGNRLGDIPYEYRSAYGTLADVDPRLTLLTFSPAARAIDFAANALPIFSSPAIAVDRAPLMAPPNIPALPVARIARPRVSYETAGFVALAAAFAALLPFGTAAGRRARARRAIAIAPQEPIVRARDVSKRFGKTQALRGADLDLYAGEAVALWGPNGSGKTTFLHALLGAIKFEGSVVVRGSVGYVPQQLPIFDMRVAELARLICGLRGLPDEHGQQALHRVDLSALAGRSVAELSGGERQRLAIALAGLGDPAILMLDEPTVGLDLASRNAILRWLSEAKAGGTTILMASHVPEDIVAIADRIAIVDNGRIVSLIAAAEFLDLVHRRREAS